jgi:hypothetical protein
MYRLVLKRNIYVIIVITVYNLMLYFCFCVQTQNRLEESTGQVSPNHNIYFHGCHV